MPFSFFLFFNHHSPLGGSFVILSSMVMHKDDPFVGPLFVFVHFRVLHYFLNVFPSCLFHSLANDTHIFNLTNVVPFAFDHFLSQLAFMGLAI
jgi:hypothetical protein